MDLVISGQQASVWSKKMASVCCFPAASLQKGRADQQMHAECFSLLSIPIERFGFILKQRGLIKSGAVALQDIGAFRRHDQLGPGLSGAGQQGLKLRTRGI